MRDGIVATIQTPFAGVGFDPNRSGFGVKGVAARMPFMSGLLLVHGNKSWISAINAQTARIAVWWNDAEGARLESILSVGNAINLQVQSNRRAAIE
jgi:hypothetical protein